MQMTNSSKFFVVIGCLLIAAAIVLKGMALVNPAVVRVVKASSLLILANTSFILAILLKK